MGEITNVKFGAAKQNIRELEIIAHDKMIGKVRELNTIVDHIESNWRGANSVKYRKAISEIIDSIEDFRINCLEPTIVDIERQVDTYETNEEEG